MKILTKALREDTDFKLELTLVVGESGLRRPIAHARAQRPGLALAGFVESLQPETVQLLGKTEISYLATLDSEARARALEGLFAAPVACAVITAGSPVPDEVHAMADRHGIAVFRTPLVSHVFTSRVHAFLGEHLSPETSIHGVLVDVFGVGVMLAGHSGIGKSECALDLVLRGHRLVADDVVQVKRRGGHLVGMGSPLTKHHMEVRGLGIINVMDLFGAASVRDRKRVELVVEMVDWRADEDYDRLGIDEMHELHLEVSVPKIRLPIRPGRNVASIVEVAARNQLLKLRGHHSALKFKEFLEQRLSASRAGTESE